MRMLSSVRALALIVLTLGVCRPSSAEDLLPHFGLQAGAAVSTFSAPSGFTTDNIAGFAIGATLEIPLAMNLAIQPEAIFVRRGANITGGGAVNVSSRYTSLEVPVFLRLKFGEGIVPVIFGGPNFSFTLSRSLTANAGGTLGTLTFNPKTVDFGLAFGAGVEIGPFFANLRYQLGVVEFDENSANWQSRGFLILAGLKF